MNYGILTNLLRKHHRATIVEIMHADRAWCVGAGREDRWAVSFREVGEFAYGKTLEDAIILADAKETASVG
jgi:hypothetical protein